MDIMQIVGLGLLTAMLSLVLKRESPEIAVQLSLVFAALIFLLILTKLSAVMDLFRELAAKAKIDLVYVGVLLKIVAIAYITEFGAQVCKDAGEGAVAGKIELAGKVMIMVMAVPIIAMVLDTLLKLIP